MTTLGILGGGALARLLARAAQQIGVNAAILDEDEFSPAAQVTSFAITSSWSDKRTLDDFINAVDAVTFEREIVPAEIIARIEKRGRRVFPSAMTLTALQDRLTQKQTLTAAGLPTVAHTAVKTREDVHAFAAQHGYPVMVKTRMPGSSSDGPERLEIKGDGDAQAAWAALEATGQPLMAEAFADYKRELSLIVVRGENGNIKHYPVTHTLHIEGHCHCVRATIEGFDHPAVELGKQVVAAVEGVGAFGIDLFEMKDGSMLISHVAPRVHTSGLYTIEGCLTSQFENHVRAVLGLPLGWTEMVKKSAVTINCLGWKEAMPDASDFEKALSFKGAHVHWYGEREFRKWRTLGHVTAVHDYEPEAERIARMSAGNLMGATEWFL